MVRQTTVVTLFANVETLQQYRYCTIFSDSHLRERSMRLLYESHGKPAPPLRTTCTGETTSSLMSLAMPGGTPLSGRSTAEKTYRTWITTIPSALVRFWIWMRHERATRLMRDALQALDDRTLKDIGIPRCQIEYAVRRGKERG
jgi:uncharacterized protein YjiS (DUF1127 family)